MNDSKLTKEQQSEWEKDWKSLEVKVRSFSVQVVVYWWMEGLPSSSFENKCYVNETLRGFLAESTSDLSHLTIKHLQEAPGTVLTNLGVESLLTSSQTTTTYSTNSFAF